jgi:hypothetical protein
MTVEYLVPSANATTTTTQILNTNNYLLIDEGITGADGSVNDTNIDDTSATGTDAIWALTDLAGFGTLNSATFRVRARLVNPGSGDVCEYTFQLAIGGDTFSLTYDTATDENNGFTNYSTGLSGGASYPYTEAQFNAATVTLTQSVYTKDMGPDGLYLDVDALELEVDYAGGTPATVPVTGVAGTGQVGSVTVSAVQAPTVAVTGLEADGEVGAVTAKADADVAVTGVEATGETSSEAVGVVASYYFDASEAGPTDPDTVWTNDFYVHDGNTSNNTTCSANGSLTTNELRMEGNTAPDALGAISQVRVRIFGGVWDAENNIVYAEILDGPSGPSLGKAENQEDYITTAWGAYVTLSTPAGGWTTDKLKALECVIYGTTDGAGYSKKVAKVELEVSSKLIYHFDLSISGPTDSQSVWSGTESLSFDRILTGGGQCPTIGSDSNNALSGAGTSAPTSGDTISQVRAMIGGFLTNLADGDAAIYTASKGELLGTAHLEIASTSFGDWVTLSAPTGGWTWTKLSQLEIYTYLNATGTFYWRANALEVTTAAGGISVTADADVSVTGLEATGSVGTVTVNIAGGIDVPVTGLEASGSVGTVTVVAVSGVDVPVTGVEGTGSVGTATVEAKANTSVTGLEGTGSVGTVTVDAAAIAVATGLLTTGYVGTATAVGEANVGVTGLEGTGAVGTVTVSTDAGIDVPVTGLEATGSVGTVAVVTDVDIPVTGLETTGSVGSVTVQGKANIPVTGIEATGSVGSVTAAVFMDVPVTGLEATGSVGSVTVTVPVDIPVTGLEAAGSVGSVTTAVFMDVPVTGLAGTGSVGSVTVTGIGNVVATGISATGSVGSVTILAGGTITVPVTGIEATGSVGSVTLQAEANVPVTGLEATGSVDSVTVAIPADVPVTGLEATGSVGTATASASATVNVTGVVGTTSVGTVASVGDANAPVIGSEATGAVGSVTVVGKATVTATGLEATGAVGQVVTDAASTKAYAVGVEATGSVGEVFIVPRHEPNQDPNWQEISPTGGSWNETAPSQDAQWLEVSPTQDSDWSDGSIDN